MFWLFIVLIVASACGVGAGVCVRLSSEEVEFKNAYGNLIHTVPKGTNRKCVIVGIVAGLTIFALGSFSQSIIVINAGHIGVVTEWGAITGRIMEPGLQFKKPYIQDVADFDTRIQKEQVAAEAASKDLQEVKATIAVNYRIDPTKASTIFQTIGTGYKERVIDPAIQEAFKASTAKYTAEEVITEREAVKEHALQRLQTNLTQFHIIIDEINIVNFDFSSEFNKAIEAKQVAKQNVERAKQDLERSRVEADQRIAEATGQAKAQELQERTLSDKYLTQLAIQKWDGKLPVVMGSENMPFIINSGITTTVK